MTEDRQRGRTDTVRDDLLATGLRVFTTVGYDATTIRQICRAAGISNGSFFHRFPTKSALARDVFLDCLQRYHSVMLTAVSDRPDAVDGIRDLIGAHLSWVTTDRERARFLFEQARAEWLAGARTEQHATNDDFRRGIETWTASLIESSRMHPLPVDVVISQIIGPAQIFCRGWLSGRDATPPTDHQHTLVQCAVRAVLIDERA